MAVRRTQLAADLKNAQVTLAGLVGRQEAEERAPPPPARPPRRSPIRSWPRLSSGGNNQGAESPSGRQLRRPGGPGSELGRGDGDRRGQELPRHVLRLGRWRQQRPRSGAGCIDQGVLGLRLQRSDAVRLRAGRDRDPGAAAQYAEAAQGELEQPGPATWCSGRPTPSNPTTIHHVAIYLGGGQIIEGAAER